MLTVAGLDSRARPRRAFTLIEMAIGIAVVTVIGAMVVVVTLDTRRSRRVAADIETLRQITTALHKFDTAVTVFPLSLLHLTTRPAATDDDSCGADFTSTGVTNWANAGPFFLQPMVGPTEIEIGTIGTTLTRIGLTTPATTPAILQIPVTGVDIDDAIELNRIIDADVLVGSASTTGTVQFPAPDPQGKVTLTWNLSIRGC